MNEHVDALVWCMSAHLQRHVGPIAHVLHSPGPELLHLDIFHVPPTPRRRCHTLFTCGMSQRPMCPPDAAGDCRFAELYLSLPPDWRVGPGRATEDAIWPLRELGELARLPHVSESWLWTGHTVAAPDPEERITPGAARRALGPRGPCHDVCPEGCCAYDPAPVRPPR